MSGPKRGWGFRTRIWLLLAVLFAMLCATMVIAITPENYTIKVGDVATENIMAVREVVDEKATDEQRLSARDAVDPVYVADSTLTADIEQRVTEFFASVDTTRGMAAQMLQDYVDDYMANGQAGTAPTYASSLTDTQWQALLGYWPVQTDQKALNVWLTMDENDYKAAVVQTRTIVSDALTSGVKEAELEADIAALQAAIEEKNASDEIKGLMKLAVSENLKTNAFYDGAATEQAREKAENAVTDVTYKKGQVVVRLGEVVTDRHMEMLGSMGMLAGWYRMAGIHRCAIECADGGGRFCGVSAHRENHRKKLYKDADDMPCHVRGRVDQRIFTTRRSAACPRHLCGHHAESDGEPDLWRRHRYDHSIYLCRYGVGGGFGRIRRSVVFNERMDLLVSGGFRR